MIARKMCKYDLYISKNHYTCVVKHPTSKPWTQSFESRHISLQDFGARWNGIVESNWWLGGPIANYGSFS